MTTTTHSHKRWTDKGGHVTFTAVQARDVSAVDWFTADGDCLTGQRKPPNL